MYSTAMATLKCDLVKENVIITPWQAGMNITWDLF
jgi:hypothetical protein